MKKLEYIFLLAIIVSLALLWDQIPGAAYILFVSFFAIAVLYILSLERLVSHELKRDLREFRKGKAAVEKDVEITNLSFAKVTLVAWITGILFKWLFLPGAGYILFIAFLLSLAFFEIFLKIRKAFRDTNYKLPFRTLFFRILVWGIIGSTLGMLPYSEFLELRYLGNQEQITQRKEFDVKEEQERIKIKKLRERARSETGIKERLEQEEAGYDFTRATRKLYVETSSSLLYYDFHGEASEHYVERMQSFYLFEVMALSIYKSSMSSREEKIYELEERGIYYYEQAIEKLDEIDEVLTDDFLRKRNKHLRIYCQLRIELYGYMLKDLKSFAASEREQIRNCQKLIDKQVEILNENDF